MKASFSKETPGSPYRILGILLIIFGIVWGGIYAFTHLSENKSAASLMWRMYTSLAVGYLLNWMGLVVNLLAQIRDRLPQATAPQD